MSGSPTLDHVAPERFHWLLHLDLDQFQVAVERRRRPELRDRQVVVGGDGDPTRARQVVTCASYEARALGVRAGMPLWVALRKAPDASYLPLDMELYGDASAQVWDAVRGLGLPVEVWGADEGYVGFGPQDGERPPATAALELADRLRTTVREATGLQCCVGISDNKQRAKIAAGFAKRAVREGGDDDARWFLIDDGNWHRLMGDRPVDALWSVGSRTAKALAVQGVSTVDELAVVPLESLVEWFGPHKGNWLYVLSRGGGDDSITVEPPPARSHSRSCTYPEDLTTSRQVHDAARALAQEVLDQVLGEGRTVVRVGVTLRTATFFTRTTLRKLPTPGTSYDAIASLVDTSVDALLEPSSDEAVAIRPIRLVAVRLELA